MERENQIKLLFFKVGIQNNFCTYVYFNFVYHWENKRNCTKNDPRIESHESERNKIISSCNSFEFNFTLYITHNFFYSMGNLTYKQYL